jgi:hypothetical protein
MPVLTSALDTAGETYQVNRRVQLDIAGESRLPVIYLVESGGADLPTQSELFVEAGRIFQKLTRLSAAGIPTIALVFGNSTAGGAYAPGMCDYAVLVNGQARVFLGDVRLGQRSPRRDGRTAAGRRHVDRRPPGGEGGGTRVRLRGRRQAQKRDRGAERAGVAKLPARRAAPVSDVVGWLWRDAE